MVDGILQAMLVGTLPFKGSNDSQACQLLSEAAVDMTAKVRVESLGLTGGLPVEHQTEILQVSLAGHKRATDIVYSDRYEDNGQDWIGVGDQNKATDEVKSVSHRQLGKFAAGRSH